MSRKCGPCGDKQRNELDRRLLEMGISYETYRTISRDFGYSVDALKRHKANHLSVDLADVHATMEQAREQALAEVHQNELEEIKVEVAEGMAARLENAVGFLDQLKEVRRKAATLLDRAENARDLRAAGIFLRELREQIRLWVTIEDRLAIKNQIKAVNPALVMKEAEWKAREEEIDRAMMSEFLIKYVDSKKEEQVAVAKAKVLN